MKSFSIGLIATMVVIGLQIGCEAINSNRVYKEPSTIKGENEGSLKNTNNFNIEMVKVQNKLHFYITTLDNKPIKPNEIESITASLHFRKGLPPPRFVEITDNGAVFTVETRVPNTTPIYLINLDILYKGEISTVYFAVRSN